jgi:hypothetical protein
MRRRPALAPLPLVLLFVPVLVAAEGTAAAQSAVEPPPAATSPAPPPADPTPPPPAAVTPVAPMVPADPAAQPPQAGAAQPPAFTVAETAPVPAPPPRPTPFYRKDWFWGGVAVVGIVALIVIFSRGSSSIDKPDTTLGDMRAF